MGFGIQINFKKDLQHFLNQNVMSTVMMVVSWCVSFPNIFLMGKMSELMRIFAIIKYVSKKEETLTLLLMYYNKQNYKICYCFILHRKYNFRWLVLYLKWKAMVAHEWMLTFYMPEKKKKHFNLTMTTPRINGKCWCDNAIENFILTNDKNCK